MSYTPTEWVTGDTITAEKLNKMEQGIEDAFVAPAVTIADEGDVLTVNSSGEWVAAAPAQGGGDFVGLAGTLTVTMTSTDITEATFAFALTSGSVSGLDSCLFAAIKAHVLVNMGEGDPIDSGWIYVPYSVLDGDAEVISQYIFVSQPVTMFADNRVQIFYNYLTSEWHASLVTPASPGD